MDLAELLALLLSAEPDLSAVSDEDLAAHEQTLINAFAERRASARGEAALTELGQIADAADVLRNEAAARIDARIADDEAIAALEARLNPVQETEEVVEAESQPEPTAEAETTVETTPEVVEAVPALAAAATPVVTTRARPNLAPLGAMTSDTPPAAQVPGTTIHILGEKTPTTDRYAIANAFIDADQYLGAARPGARVLQPVIKVKGATDPNRHMQFGAQAHNDALLSRMWSRPALLAAGGFCGPSQPIYDMAMISSAATPVNDGLGGPTINGTRGSVTFNRPLALADFAAGVTPEWSPGDEDKACVDITCSSPVTEDIVAFVHCVNVDNFMDRYSPEMVAQAIDLTMVNWASARETWLLDRIKNSDKKLTADNVIGAAADINYTIGLAAAGYRNSDRMLSDVGLRVLLPAWVLDMYIGDVARAQHAYPEQLRMARATVEANLANLGVRPTFYIDSPSDGPSQVFGAQSDGALNQYPSAIQWALFHEGAHAKINGGPELNFGVVRDSSQNAANTYQAFGESFEGYAFLGVKSWWITQDVCPAGAFSAPTDLFSEMCGAS